MQWWYKPPQTISAEEFCELWFLPHLPSEGYWVSWSADCIILNAALGWTGRGSHQIQIQTRTQQSPFIIPFPRKAFPLCNKRRMGFGMVTVRKSPGNTNACSWESVCACVVSYHIGLILARLHLSRKVGWHVMFRGLSRALGGREGSSERIRRTGEGGRLGPRLNSRSQSEVWPSWTFI